MVVRPNTRLAGGEKTAVDKSGPSTRYRKTTRKYQSEIFRSSQQMEVRVFTSPQRRDGTTLVLVVEPEAALPCLAPVSSGHPADAVFRL